ncbi:MAG: DUF2283 domain-containing protein [Methylocystis sp.]|nr:DUF2283 domain-containing protein [Methylocystis sp.]MBI3274889.1 DUF2283 domain-containing protein [Methylocystis sp.]
MKMTYDSETDALYLRFSSAPIVESEEVRPGLVLDFDSEGHIVAIELLDAKTQVPPDALASNAAQ